MDQQISSHYEQCREKIVNWGPNTAPSLPFFPVSFSLGHNGNNGYLGGVLGKGDEEEEEEDALLMRGSEQYVPGSRNIKLTVPPHSWHNQEDSPIKQPPLWRPRFTELLNGNDKRCMEAEEIKEEVHEQNQNKRFKCSEEGLLVDESARKILENCCRLTGDLESIYGGSAINKTNQMCRGSVQELEAFSGDEKEDLSREVKNGREGDKMRDSNPQIESMADFFNSLVNRLMDHQESLHQRFLETIEKLDGKRREREDAWRQQELARLNQEAIARSRDQALASSREATIVSYLEKIMGQSIILPSKTLKAAEIMDVNTNMEKRWPKFEVEALIRTRTSLEPKFHDPTLKGFVWEEISKLMASMGYRRSAQRCKEKWLNINRYYKKAKENSKLQGPQKRNTCPYFKQLDQFYKSKSFTNGSSSYSSSFSSKLQGRNLLSLGNVKEIQEWWNRKDDKELNHQIEGNKDEDDDEDDDEDEEEEGSDPN